MEEQILRDIHDRLGKIEEFLHTEEREHNSRLNKLESRVIRVETIIRYSLPVLSLAIVVFTGLKIFFGF